MIGLGVGIDYGLFIVTRHRDQLGAGMEPAGVDRARDRDLRRRRRVRRQHGDHRAALARWSPASRSSPRSATPRPSSSSSRCWPRSRCCRPSSACSARGSTRCRCPGLRTHHDQAPARLAAAGPGSSPTTRGRPSSSACSCSSCSPRRCATSHLGQTDNGALPKDTQTAPVLRPHDPRLRRRLERPDARRRRPERSRRRTTRSSSTRSSSSSPTRRPSSSRPRSSRTSPRTPTRPPRPSSRSSSSSLHGLRPAPADAADRHPEDLGRQVGDPAAGQQRRHRRRLHA